MSMPKQAMLFGILLIVLSSVSYFAAAAGVGGVSSAEGNKAPSVTLFIPAIFGVLLLGCGAVAMKEELRKHAMHAASVIALLGGVVSGGRGLSKLFATADPEKPTNMLATISVWGMAILCFVFLALCVRSFIAAAKARRAAQANS